MAKTFYDWEPAGQNEQNIVGSRLADTIQRALDVPGFSLPAQRDIALAELLLTKRPLNNLNAFNVIGDGATDDGPALAALEAGYYEALPGTYRIATNITIASDVAIVAARGSVFKVEAGVTLTINGPITAGLFQVFDVSAGGRVVFGPGAVDVVYPEWWGVDGTFAGDTAAWQAAIDAAQAVGGTVLGVSGKTYRITNLLVTGDCVLDFNGASVIAHPADETGSGAPWLLARGEIEGADTFEPTAAGAREIVLSSVGAGGKYQPGDYVVIGDRRHVPAWNAGEVDEGPGYWGRSEVAVVKSVDGDTLTLVAPLEWDYDTTTSCERVKAMPKVTVRNIGSLTEVDPGTVYNGDWRGDVPYIIRFEYCKQPVVQRCTFNGWNVHAVNAAHCISPVVEDCDFFDPYRPDEGGHGYAIRYSYCKGGEVSRNVSKRCRHTFDMVMSYDSTSRENTAIETMFTAFFMHGHGSKRYTSINDRVYGEAEGREASGWSMGNSDFSGDYDMTVIAPRCRGISWGVTASSLSRGLTVIAPQIQAELIGIRITTGVERVRVSGGFINMASTFGDDRRAILIRPKRSFADAYGRPVKDVVIENVDIYAPRDAVCGLELSVGGALGMHRNRFYGAPGLGELVRIGSGDTPTELVCEGNTYRGECTIGLDIRSAPTGLFHVYGEDFDGHTSAPTRIVPTPSLRFESNRTTTGGFVNWGGSVIEEVVAGGAVITRNEPQPDIPEERASWFMADRLYAGSFRLAGPAGTNRDLVLATQYSSVGGAYNASRPRWLFRITGDAESGANAGSDLRILRRSDDGTALGTVLSISRATGEISATEAAFTVAGTWDKPFRLGSNSLWVDEGGLLRIKHGGLPSSDTDGIVVGSQEEGV